MPALSAAHTLEHTHTHTHTHTCPLTLFPTDATFRPRRLPRPQDACTFDLLVYTDNNVDVPQTWEESDPKYINNQQVCGESGGWASEIVKTRMERRRRRRRRRGRREVNQRI